MVLTWGSGYSQECNNLTPSEAVSAATYLEIGEPLDFSYAGFAAIYEILDTSIATVDQTGYTTGTVYGVSEGTTTLKITVLSNTLVSYTCYRQINVLGYNSCGYRARIYISSYNETTGNVTFTIPSTTFPSGTSYEVDFHGTPNTVYLLGTSSTGTFSITLPCGYNSSGTVTLRAVYGDCSFEDDSYDLPVGFPSCSSNRMMNSGTEKFPIDNLIEIGKDDKFIQSYPNKTSSVLNFSGENLEENSIEVYDLQGNVVIGKQTLTSSINLEAQKPGVYIYVITDGKDFRQEGKIIKE